ncbi:hypothetical protein [Streptomyces sp. NBC_00151]|uniref:hypothetical protein n=1 Tax=Streptomyces sp. NBC_00151 TaxID=2975669 RepID=UPI002DDA38C1|nr:hypothetical protein [Streptomyces sp. NBC_00151]WRZ41890.1 hypothetical protein OG915_29925 [Streptomyces sp. NBC_00151]
MTEPNPLAKAEAAAAEAAVNTAAVQIALAAVELAKLSQTQQQAPACQHQSTPASQFNAKKWLVIGGTACVCSLAFALASIAIAIGACCATACLLVLRSMWRDIQKHR